MAAGDRSSQVTGSLRLTRRPPPLLGSRVTSPRRRPAARPRDSFNLGFQPELARPGQSRYPQRTDRAGPMPRARARRGGEPARCRGPAGAACRRMGGPGGPGGHMSAMSTRATMKASTASAGILPAGRTLCVSDKCVSTRTVTEHRVRRDPAGPAGRVGATVCVCARPPSCLGGRLAAEGRKDAVRPPEDPPGPPEAPCL